MGWSFRTCPRPYNKQTDRRTAYLVECTGPPVRMDRGDKEQPRRYDTSVFQGLKDPIGAESYTKAA